MSFTYSEPDAPRFNYEFFVWPRHPGELSTETIDLLYRNQPRHQLTFTERQWANYSAALERDGLTLREVTREIEEWCVIHMCPPISTGLMPCCGLPPFERRTDRMTTDPRLVTCGKGGPTDER